MEALYDPRGEYSDSGGISAVAIGALVAGVLPSLPGFLLAVKLVPAAIIRPWLATLYGYAWFVGFGVAFAFYLVLQRLFLRG